MTTSTTRTRTRRNPALGLPVPREYRGLAVETRLVRSRGWDPRKAPAITSPVDVVTIARKLTQSDRERLLALYLNVQNRVVGIEQLGVGSLSQALVDTGALMRAALMLAVKRGAAGFILVHNHPSGIAEPSAADRKIHEQLGRAAALLDLKLLDTVVVADGAYVSLAERGT